MKKLGKYILQGLLTVLPLGLTLYFFYWVLASVEKLVKPLLLSMLPEYLYVPGMGVLAMALTLIVIGIVVNFYVVRYLVKLGNRLLEKIPLVKSVYSTFQDIITVFKLSDNKEDQLDKVVSIDMGNDTQLIGFVTGRESGKQLFPDADKVGVYIPMSYQVGGFTVYVEKERLTALDIGAEEAMRLAVTAGAKSRHSDDDT